MLESMSSTIATGKSASRKTLSPTQVGWLVFAFFLVLYALSAQHGPAWQDSGIFQWRIVRFDVQGWLGLALSHPLLIILGKAFAQLPFGSFFWRVNLLSAVSGAAAVAAMTALVRRLRPDRPASAWIAAGFLGLGHTLWWLSSICESQTLLLAIFAFELLAVERLIRRPAVSAALLLGLLNGLGLTAHNLALLALPGYGVLVLILVIRRRLRPLGLAGFVSGWVFGASGYLLLVALEATQVGLGEAVRSALFGVGWQGAVLGGTGRAVAMGLCYIVFNFPNFALPLAVVGLWRGRRMLSRPLYGVMLYLLGIYLLFAICYRVPDQFMFFLPCYAMLVFWAAVGLASFGPGLWRARWTAAAAISLVVTPLLYVFAPVIWHAAGQPLPGRKDLPRDAGRYWLVPWKTTEDSAGDFARDVFDALPPKSAVIVDGTTHYPLLLGREIMGLGPADVRLLPSPRPAQVLGHEPTYTVTRNEAYLPDWLAAYELEPVEAAPLYRVRWNAP